MKTFFVGPMTCAVIIGVITLASPAAAKTAKECRAEWTADKAANQAKGITEKAYIDKCKAEASAEKPKAAPAAASAADEKASKAKTSKTAAPAAGDKKTVKECETEWRADKAANQAKGITEKAYVEQCRGGTAAATPAAAPATSAPAQTKTAPPKTESTETKMAPPTTASAKGTAAGANQFAAESAAKTHCPTGLVVWANLDSKIYHFSGHADYGHTKQGAYMCEKDAMGEGMRAAKNEKHP
ncbi:MAG TPA: hypothetical protein VGF53_10505 [Pseudolabrys sp.]|jgi:hypothetical protein